MLVFNVVHLVDPSEMGEDVELCLEVQVDPASKKILSNPEKCKSTLLDVTVVKPKELEAFGTQRTNILRADEVRKLITSLEKQRRKKQKYLDQLKYDDTIIKVRRHNDFYDNHHRSRKPFTKHKERISSTSPIDDLERKDFIGIAESVEPLFCEIRRSLKNVETRITNMQDINLVISQTTIGATASEEYVFPKQKNRNPLPNAKNLRNQSVYRVETGPQDLKSILLCQNKQNKFLERGDKIEGKCLCENCGIVGLLMECQKHPMLSELSESPAPSEHKQILTNPKKSKVTNYAHVKHDTSSDAAYISQLTKRVKVLEERLAMQEEKVVPKDYFKKIITKMVNNFSPKVLRSKSDISMPYSERTSRRSAKHEKCPIHSSRAGKSQHTKSTETVNCFNASLHYPSPRRRRASNKNDKSTITDDDIYFGGNIWRWGEEILRPGIDLKNRIITLLNDILSKFTITEKGSSETTKLTDSVKGENYNSETIKKFMKHINTNVFNAQINTKSKFLTGDYARDKKDDPYQNLRSTALTEFSRRSHEENLEKMRMNQPKRENKNIDVSYVNPKLSLWRTESPRLEKTENKASKHTDNATGTAHFCFFVCHLIEFF